MPQGNTSAYTGKQNRQALHIQEGYRKKGVSAGVAEVRAWATLNKTDESGKNSGAGKKKSSTA